MRSLNPRERFLSVYNHEKFDRVPDYEFGFWEETLRNWTEKGQLPKEVASSEKAKEYFELEKFRNWIPIENWSHGAYSVGMYPPFERKVIEETEEYELVRDKNGIVVRNMKKHDHMPQWIEFPVKSKEDFYELRTERYNAPTAPERYPNWDQACQKWRNRDYPLGHFCGSLYGWLRYWTGVEKLSQLFIKDPDWVHEMMDFLTEHILQILSHVLNQLETRGVQLDYVFWWEDMCYNKGPLISPEMFKEFMLPRYKRVMELVQEHGVDVALVDSDGKIYELVPLWLEAGINCMWPIEVAHTKPETLQEKYGDKILMMGGIDKRALIEGSERAIDKELEKLPPLLKQGGYIPHVDHSIPADVDFESFHYYLEKKREIIGRKMD